MPEDSNRAIKSEIPAVQLGYDSRFAFRCHKGVRCFTDCCRGIDIMLTPYDILTMRKVLELTSEEFLAIYTEPRMLERAELPVVTLKLQDDERRSCPFVTDDKGCIIYKDRPTTCRYYPLGVGSLSYTSEEGEKDEFFFTVKEDHCFGFQEDKEWTVAEWRYDQGIEVREEIDEGWMDLIVRKKTLPQFMKLTEKSREMFFMACYNIDKFRKFVFESSFLDRYSIDKKRVDEIKEDDTALLRFGFDWLKATFFQAGEEKFRVKNPE